MKLIFLLHIFYFERCCPCFGKYLICSYLSIWKYFQIDKYEQIKYFLKDRKTLSKGKIRNNKISFNNLYIKYLYSKTFVFPHTEKRLLYQNFVLSNKLVQHSTQHTNEYTKEKSNFFGPEEFAFRFWKRRVRNLLGLNNLLFSISMLPAIHIRMPCLFVFVPSMPWQIFIAFTFIF